MTTSLTYLRRSKTKTAAERATSFDTVSVEDQRTRLAQVAAAHGYTPSQEFADDGVSAYREDVSRPAFDALCRLIDSGDVEGAVVLADAPDRLSRQGGEAYLAFRRLCRAHGVRIHTASHGLDDPDDDNSEIPAFLAGWQSNQESKVKSRRLRNASTERAQRGQQRGAGITPFGWSQDDRRSLDPAQTAMLRAAKDRVLSGGSVRGIARAWNETGVETNRGGKWTHQGLTAALTRPRNAGLVQLRREVLDGVTGDWEPLWDVETHQALVSMLGNRALTQMTGTGGRKGYTATSLLAGIARCACGGPMRLSRMSAQRDLYRCDARDENAGPHVAIRQDLIEAEVRTHLLMVMLMGEADQDDDPEVMALSALYASRASIRTQVARLVDAVKIGALAPQDVAADRADLDAQAQALEARINALVESNAKAALVTELRRSLWEGTPDLADMARVGTLVMERFDAMPMEDQRAVIRHYLTVQVMPGRGKRAVIAARVPMPDRYFTMGASKGASKGA